jgi:hypothetical protein
MINMEEKNLKPVNVIEEGEPFRDRISGWFNVRKKGLADYYEKENGKYVKKATILFSKSKGKFHGKYLLLKTKAIHSQALKLGYLSPSHSSDTPQAKAQPPENVGREAS